ncbi:MAG: response regulator transcription factor [Bacteroidia bacterium]
MNTVAIIDDQTILVEGLKSLLNNCEGIRVAQVFTNPLVALDRLDYEKIDVILLDIHMPQMSGLEVCWKIKAKAPRIKILALTTYDEGELIRKMLEKGADGYLLKNTDIHTLEQSINAASIGEKVISNELKNKMIESLYNAPNQDEKVRLTRREKDVLIEIANGLKIHEIAEKLFISENTVVSHRKNLFSKFGVHNAPTLIKKALEQNIL